MATYTIKHTCGHVAHHNICGTNVNGQRDNKVKYLESKICQDCDRAKKLEEAKQANADLPQLTGTVKQIAWAEQIRAAAVKSLTDIKDIVVANYDNSPENADKLIKVIDETLSKTESTFWINNRGVSFDQNWASKILDNK